MNIPPDVARAQGHHGAKGAVHGIKGGRPRLNLTEEERVQRRRDRQLAYRRRKGIMPKQVLTWEERLELNQRQREARLNEEYRRVWGKPPGEVLTAGEFARRQGVFRAWVRRCKERNCPLHSPVDFVRGHFREERRRRREEDWENDPNDGYSDDEAAEMMEAAGREIRARSRREAELRGLILSALPPAPAPSVGRNQPCPCGSGRKSKKCCGR